MFSIALRDVLILSEIRKQEVILRIIFHPVLSLLAAMGAMANNPIHIAHFDSACCTGAWAGLGVAASGIQRGAPGVVAAASQQLYGLLTDQKGWRA